MDRQHEIILPTLCWGRRHRDFYAVTVDVSRNGIRLRSSTVPAVSDELICSICHVGLVEVRVGHVDGRDFTVRIQGGRGKAIAVNRRLLSLAKQQASAAQQTPGSGPAGARRQIVPVQRAIAVTLACGTVMPSRILNVSPVGVAVLLDAPLRRGTPIVVGTTRARVARTFEGGVGATFARPFDPRAVHEHMTL